MLLKNTAAKQELQLMNWLMQRHWYQQLSHELTRHSCYMQQLLKHALACMLPLTTVWQLPQCQSIS
jgi:uncharacterized membrane protein YbaN (DUF454 family)